VWQAAADRGGCKSQQFAAELVIVTKWEARGFDEFTHGLFGDLVAMEVGLSGGSLLSGQARRRDLNRMRGTPVQGALAWPFFAGFGTDAGSRQSILGLSTSPFARSADPKLGRISCSVPLRSRICVGCWSGAAVRCRRIFLLVRRARSGHSRAPTQSPSPSTTDRVWTSGVPFRLLVFCVPFLPIFFGGRARARPGSILGGSVMVLVGRFANAAYARSSSDSAPKVGTRTPSVPCSSKLAQGASAAFGLNLKGFERFDLPPGGER